MGPSTTRAIAVHRASRPVESALTDGIPVTTVARTLADLAEVGSRRGLEKALDQAEALRLLDVAEIDAVAVAQPGRAGPA